MSLIVGLLLIPLTMIVVRGLNLLATNVAMILAARRMAGDPRLKNPYAGEPPETRDQALEYLRHPEVGMTADYLRKSFRYRFLITAGPFDAVAVLIAFFSQSPGPEIWYAAFFVTIVFTLIEYTSVWKSRKLADGMTDPGRYPAKTEAELIGFAQKVHGYSRDAFRRIGRQSGRPWKILCAVCAAAAVLLLGAQLDYAFRVKDAGAGTLKVGGWQYRVLDDGTAEVVRYTGMWAKVTVPSSLHGVPVSSVGPDAFRYQHGNFRVFGRKEMTSVRLPEGLRRIGDGAFRYCSVLSEVYIPDSVTRIGDEAFRNCGMLEKIVLPDGLTHIGDSAFRGCHGITGIRIPDSVTEIGIGPFADCADLQRIEITENQPLLRACGGGLCRRENGELLWYPAAGYSPEVTVPPGVRRIGAGAFFGFARLEKVILPEGLEEIGDEAFSDCYHLREAVFPDGLLIVGDRAFSSCRNLTEAVLPDSVRTVGGSAFSSCAGLASVHLPDSLTRIGEYAFYRCESLREIDIPAGVAEIPAGTFDGCKSLARVSLPEGLTAIGLSAFADCGKLKSVAVPAGVRDFGSRNPFAKGTLWIVTPGSAAEEFCRLYLIPFRYAGEEEPARE